MVPRGQSPNVLLVTVDCMRRDRVSAYGYRRRTTPFLDSLIERSVHCTSAYSTSSWTAPAVASMLTGLYPHNHGAGLIEGDPKNLSRDRLPTTLGSRSIVSDAFNEDARAALTAVGVAFFPFEDARHHFPLHGGRVSKVPDAKLVSLAIEYAGALQRPFFCWVHLGGAHDPLDVPRGRREEFGRVRYRSARRWAFTKRDDPVGSEAFVRYREEREALYDAAVLEADSQVEALWNGLGAERDRTVLIVTADHGEEHWEHRDEEIESFDDPRDVAGVGHGQNLWQEILLVPLIVHGPGIPAGAISANTSLADVALTILEVIGAEASGDLDGVSLLGAQPGDRAVTAQGIAYGHEKSAVIAGDRKLLSSPGDGYERVFVLDAEHREARTDDDPDVAALLRDHLPPAAWASGSSTGPADEQMSEHLRHLGYIE